MDGIIYAPTQSIRATLVQEARIFLPPEKDQILGCYRHVQVMVPESPRVSITFDCEPTKLGPNREYKLPVWSPGAQIRFDMLPDQWLTGCSNIGYAEVGLIIEYRHSEKLAAMMRSQR
jgi:hypothetical protein